MVFGGDWTPRSSAENMKTNMDTQNDGLEKVTHMAIFGIYVRFLGKLSNIKFQVVYFLQWWCSCYYRWTSLDTYVKRVWGYDL